MAVVCAALLFIPIGCATDGVVDAGVGFYGSYWEDPWYWSGCCADSPDLGPPPPRPEHPIANPGDPRPSHPIANAPDARPSQPSSTTRSMPSPRPAMRSGGGGRGGRR